MCSIAGGRLRSSTLSPATNDGESRSHAGSAFAGFRGTMLERPHSTIERSGGRSHSPTLPDAATIGSRPRFTRHQYHRSLFDHGRATFASAGE